MAAENGAWSEASGTLRLMGSGPRLRLLSAIRTSGGSVGAVAEAAGLERNRASTLLAGLRLSGLVEHDQHDRARHYRLTETGDRLLNLAIELEYER